MAEVKKRLIIGVGGIRQESNTFSTIPTILSDFTVFSSTLPKTDLLHDRFKDFDQVELVPIFEARALPGGPVLESCYLNLKERFIQSIESVVSSLDGILLFLHGAMHVVSDTEKYEISGRGNPLVTGYSAEADLAIAIRKIAPDLLLSVSLDLHANVNHSLVENVDILTAFRTAPHVDQLQTKQRALSLLLQAIRENLRPKPVLIKLPLILSGEEAMTTVEPAKTLYSLSLGEVNSQKGIMDCSILIGCAWSDSPATGVSVVVIANDAPNVSLARKSAISLANHIWKVRREFSLGQESASVDEGIQRALLIVKSQQKIVFLNDSGDNMTAGAPGESAFVAGRLMAAQLTCKALVAGITSPMAVSHCVDVGLGNRLDFLQIGGQHSGDANSISVRNAVVRQIQYDSSSQVVSVFIETPNAVDIILAPKRRSYELPIVMTQSGADLSQYGIILVKFGYLPDELKAISNHSIILLSKGATNLCLKTLEFIHQKRPAFPFDEDCLFEGERQG